MVSQRTVIHAFYTEDMTGPIVGRYRCGEAVLESVDYSAFQSDLMLSDTVFLCDSALLPSRFRCQTIIVASAGKAYPSAVHLHMRLPSHLDMARVRSSFFPDLSKPEMMEDISRCSEQQLPKQDFKL